MLREATYLIKQQVEHKSWHIDLYYPNSYYGKKQEYINNGYTLDGDYLSKSSTYGCTRIHVNVFERKNSCISVAEFEYNSKEDCYEFRYIGKRPLDLNEEDKKSFDTLVTIGFNMLNTDCNYCERYVVFDKSSMSVLQNQDGIRYFDSEEEASWSCDDNCVIIKL